MADVARLRDVIRNNGISHQKNETDLLLLLCQVMVMLEWITFLFRLRITIHGMGEFGFIRVEID